MVEKVTHITDFDEEYTTLAEGITIELDDSANLSANNEVRSDFAPDGVDKAFLRVIVDNRDFEYEIKHNGTKITKEGTNIAIEHTETLKFYDEATQELAYKPIVSKDPYVYTFIGAQPKNENGKLLVPTFDGKTVRFPESVVASIEVTYKYSADRWGLTSQYSGDILVVAIQDRNGEIAKDTEDVTFTAEAGETQEYTLVVKDFCDDAEIAGATVYLNGALVGTTGNDGTIFLGELFIGQEYFLRVTKTGYINSDEDTLLNDSFIPES